MALSAPSATLPPSYVYKPLPISPATIRLLKIEAEVSSFDDPILCELHHVGLDPPLEHEYTGLSYAWGEPIFDHIIHCDGHMIKVTSHLHKALQRLRQANVCWAWIDAICIDQSNIPERNAQVSIMGRIYGQTQMTYVYLGEAGEDGARVADLIRHLRFLQLLSIQEEPKTKLLQLRNLNYDNENWNKLFKALCDLKNTTRNQERNRCLQSLGLPVTSHRLWHGYHDIWERPWFERGWVVQEAVLSPRLLFLIGSEILDLHDIVQSWIFAYDSIHINGVQGLTPVNNVTPVRIMLLRFRQEPGGLMQLLRHFRPLTTTDPRDKIFSLLGLAKDSGVAAPKPDYHQSAVDVFTSYAKYLMQNQHGNRLDILLDAGVALGSTRQTMTWVPQWDKKLTSFLDKAEFSAAGLAKADFSYGKDSSLLVRGVIFDKVENFATEAALSTDLEMWDLRTWYLWERKTSDFVQQSSRFCASNYAKALVAERCDVSTYSSSDPLGPSLRFADIYEHTLAGTDLEVRDQEYIAQCSGLHRGHIFVLTHRDYMGWVPKCTEEGDLICIVFGVRMPLVIRQVEDGKYILIGPAYIEGIMHGEALEENNVEGEDIELV